MSDLLFVYIEDKKDRVASFEMMFDSVRKKFLNIDYKICTFESVLNSANFFSTNEIDYLILDLYDENSQTWEGLKILDNIKAADININTIIYTGDKLGAEGDVDFTERYKFVIKVLDKRKNNINGLKEYMVNLVSANVTDQFSIDSDYIDEFSQQLYFFGVNRLNQILVQVKENWRIPLEKSIRLYKMSSGFSGAVLLKFKYENTWYVLKVSNNVGMIESEIDRAKKYYPLFPSKFFNHIAPKAYYSTEKDAVGALIKIIDDTKTLFVKILEADSKESIVLIMEKIFFENGLMKHYESKLNSELSWTSILKKFSEGRFVTIKEVSVELESLLVNFNMDELEKFITKFRYRELNIDTVEHNGAQTLNHLDLHSKNILIQGVATPFLIDTGVMDYGYWCLDLCRLIVDLFINGIDHGRKEFYDIGKISDNIRVGVNVIKLQTLDSDKNNENIITVLNWLIENIEVIYKKYYTKWEFQLGLMKEFLQMSYRTGTVPHSKRALALELAYICMIEAECNVRDYRSEQSRV